MRLKMSSEYDILYVSGMDIPLYVPRIKQTHIFIPIIFSLLLSTQGPGVISEQSGGGKQEVTFRHRKQSVNDQATGHQKAFMVK